MSSSDVNQPEKMNLESMSISDHQKAKLKELFPEVFTEGLKVDFDQLKRTLGEMVDGGKERFGMQWAGKADCFKTIGSYNPDWAIVKKGDETLYMVRETKGIGQELRNSEQDKITCAKAHFEALDVDFKKVSEANEI